MKLRKGFKSVLVMIMTVLCMFVMPVMSASADSQGATDRLYDCISSGKDTSTTAKQIVDPSTTYVKENGGTVKYSELLSKNTSTNKYDGSINEAVFNELKSTEKEKFLTDMHKVAMAAVQSDSSSNDANKVTDKTVTNWLQKIQQCDGVGSQLMNTLLQNTKPDYATANRIYEPFSGVVGTVLGLGAILIMAFLGITMVLDLSYIGIPAFRLMLNGEDAGKTKPKVISYEAVSAVETAEGGGGAGGQNGSTNKVAVGIYFKKRVIMLIVLGICLLYLIQGQIFTLVSWILDLVSGFLGF